MEQVIAAGILLGAVTGALVCSRLSEVQGRRRTIQLVSIVFILGALVCAVAPSAWPLAAARVLLGFAVGGATHTVPMSVAELAPARTRGRLILTFQVGISVGIVVSTLVGASEAVSWRISIGAAAAPALVMLLLMLRLPESPAGWSSPATGMRPAACWRGSVRPEPTSTAGSPESSPWRTSGSRWRRRTGAGTACANPGCGRHSSWAAAWLCSRS